ncbi:MAG TPA: hypothetical protein PKC30_10485 [Saprospiraceae bacterium]|nr:hypothetical protein [Saprospiraceae bacterium]
MAMIRMTFYHFFLCLTFTLIVGFGCKSDNARIYSSLESDLPSFFSKIYDLDSITLILETSFQSIMDDREEEKSSYQKAYLTIMGGGSEALTTEINVRPRGVTRKSLCDFPPLMLKLKKKQRETLEVRDSDNIKIVTQCMNQPEYQQYVHKEYLHYKIYNTITDHSFRVKWLNVIYKDSNKEYDDFTSVGFIIEPTDVMTHRLGCSYDENDTSPVKNLDKSAYKNFVVFQYMMGNTDWNLSERHNIRMITCSSATGPVPVPYDFDYSGTVNAEYAKPHPMLPIQSVTERLFQFRGPADEDFSENYAFFNDKKDEFFEIVQESSFLNSETKKEILQYLEGFYKNISSSEIMKAEIMKVRKKS